MAARCAQREGRLAHSKEQEELVDLLLREFRRAALIVLMAVRVVQVAVTATLAAVVREVQQVLMESEGTEAAHRQQALLKEGEVAEVPMAAPMGLLQ